MHEVQAANIVFADTDNLKGIPENMKIRSILPITLCLFLMTACSGKKTEPVKDEAAAFSSSGYMAQEDMEKEDDKEHTSIYERFLNNEETVSFYKDQGKELTLSEITSWIEDYYNTKYEDFPEVTEVWVNKIEYAYFDCGRDGAKELALKIVTPVTGRTRTEYIILKESGGRLRMLYCDSDLEYSVFRITEYGYIESIHYLDGDICGKYIDMHGEVHDIFPEVDKDFFIGNGNVFLETYNAEKVEGSKEEVFVEEIRNGKEVSWKELYSGKNCSEEGVDYAVYDRFIDWLKEECKKDPSDRSEELEDIVCSSAPFPDISDEYGYIKKDIDGDGVDELLLGNGETIFSMYTILNGKMYHVISGGIYRDLWSFCENGIIEENMCFSSDGALTNYKYSSGELNEVEGLYRHDCNAYYVDRDGNYERFYLEDIRDFYSFKEFKKYKHKELKYTPIKENVK